MAGPRRDEAMGQIIEWRRHRHELNLLNDGLAAPGVNRP